jgi:polysaccharide biosynthesis/export protein
VVRANGAVVASDGSRKWFRGERDTQIRPGDTIVVPMDVDRVPALALWQSSTTILYNLAIAVAAIGAL